MILKYVRAKIRYNHTLLLDPRNESEFQEMSEKKGGFRRGVLLN